MSSIFNDELNGLFEDIATPDKNCGTVVGFRVNQDVVVVRLDDGRDEVESSDLCGPGSLHPVDRIYYVQLSHCDQKERLHIGSRVKIIFCSMGNIFRLLMDNDMDMRSSVAIITEVSEKYITVVAPFIEKNVVRRGNNEDPGTQNLQAGDMILTRIIYQNSFFKMDKDDEIALTFDHQGKNLFYKKLKKMSKTEKRKRVGEEST